jgi:hypothetical protein
MNLSLASKSPLYHLYNEVLNGLTSIKLYGQRSTYIKKFSEKLNLVTRGKLNLILC